MLDLVLKENNVLLGEYVYNISNNMAGTLRAHMTRLVGELSPCPCQMSN